MITAIASIIIAISVSITIFIQTITLSGCKLIECCGSKYNIDDPPWYDRPVPKDRNAEEQSTTTLTTIEKHRCRLWKTVSEWFLGLFESVVV
jgi:hypothetical protein